MSEKEHKHHRHHHSHCKCHSSGRIALELLESYITRTGGKDFLKDLSIYLDAYSQCFQVVHKAHLEMCKKEKS